MAPELVGGGGHGKGVDYWALGVVLFEMLVGFTPFVGDNANDPLAISHRIVSGAPIEWPQPGDEDYVEVRTCRRLPSMLFPSRFSSCERLDPRLPPPPPPPPPVINDPHGQVAPEAKDLVEKLLLKEPLERLGCQKDGVDDIRSHALYKLDLPEQGTFNWTELGNHSLPAVWKPTITSDRDVSNFDDIYDDEPEEFYPYDGNEVWDF